MLYLAMPPSKDLAHLESRTLANTIKIQALSRQNVRLAKVTYPKSYPSHSPVLYRNLSLDCFEPTCD